MGIYLELFFNNIQNFLEGAFPIAKEILGEARWLELVREFVHLHPSESPYFLQISQEFLTFLADREHEDLPDFLLELCHYEWVELSLDVAEDVEVPTHDPNGELLGRLVLNPYMRALTYGYVVQEIGLGNQPESQPAQPTYLIVYRNEALKVKFVASNPVTHRLLELLDSQSGAEALGTIGKELAESGREVDAASLERQGRAILASLRDQGIVLGERVE